MDLKPKMPDTRKHRGPHPADAELFGPATWPVLREAVEHLSWLLSRGYAWASALKLVGDRFQLTERQRLGVLRSSCSDAALESRGRRQVRADELRGSELHLDGFNVLTSLEAALAGGVVLLGRDRCYRDMASMHGSYRKMAETRPAITLLGEVTQELGVAEARLLLDSPVSNSGRLSGVVLEVAEEHGWSWRTELVQNPDPVLITSPAVVATADSVILDGCARWFNLAREVIDRRIPEAQIVPLGEERPRES